MQPLYVVLVLLSCFLSSALAATTTVQPGVNTLQDAYEAASAGDTLVLDDGVYKSTNCQVLRIKRKAITVRALNAGQAVIDGENMRRGLRIDAENNTMNSAAMVPVVIEGLNVTQGLADENTATCSDNTESSSDSSGGGGGGGGGFGRRLEEGPEELPPPVVSVVRARRHPQMPPSPAPLLNTPLKQHLRALLCRLSTSVVV